MAVIKNYMKEKEKLRGKEPVNYQDKISRYKARNLYRILLVLVAVIALVAIIIVQFRRHVYTGYDVVATVDRSGFEGTIDKKLGGNILTYSKDGVHCTDVRGNVTWNQTYEIQDVKMAICGDTVAVGDYNGTNVYVLNTSKQLSEINTTYPIRDLTVSADGHVTVVVDADETAYLNTYDPSGNMIYQGWAKMNGSGYPAALCLSPDGELLCVSYWYVDTGVLKTNVVFYNFGPVGANSNDFAVSAFSYTDVLIPQVQFVDDSTAFAVGDSRLVLYKGNHIPVEFVTRLFDEEVKSVFYSDQYIGLVFRSEDGDHLYRMDVFDAKTKNADNFLLGSYYIDIDYTDIFFGQKNFTVYNERECVITTMDGFEKFNGTFDESVRLMIPIGKSYKYLLVTDTTFDTIQLK